MRMQRREFLRLGAAAVAAGGFVGRAWGVASQPRTRRILYLAGQVSPALVERLGPSGFDVAILAFLYARWRRGRLELRYNARPARALPAGLGRELRRLRRGFAARKRVMISLGGWGSSATFAAIRSAGVERFLEQFDREFVTPLGLEGIDLDLEPSTVAENTPAGWRAVHEEYGATLVALTNGYKARHPDHDVSHAPIASVAAALYARDGGLRSVGGSFFEATRTARGNNLSWLNVQFYEAGDPKFGLDAGAKPARIPEFYQRELLVPLWRARAATGIARPWERLVPGFEPRYHQTLAFCEQTLRSINDEVTSLAGVSTAAGGVFVWDYAQIAARLPAWSAGLERALEPD
jgi:hypothetical protein